MKKWIKCMMIIALLFSIFFCFSSLASADGTCGPHLTWALDEMGTLTISGTGLMNNYDPNYHAPWYSKKALIKRLVIDDGVTTIGDHAFYNCSNLKNIVFSNSVNKICSWAFSNCTSLENVTIPNSVTSIYLYAFSNCSSLISVTIPNSVTGIGKRVFSNCSKLENVTIHANIKSIGEYAFGGSGIKKIYIPGNNDINIDDTAFYKTNPSVYCYEFSPGEVWAKTKGYNIVLLDNLASKDYLTVTLPKTAVIGIGKKAKLESYISLQLDGYEPEWTSSDPSVVTTDIDGNLTGIYPGQTNITLSYGGVESSCLVYVVQFIQDYSLPEIWLVSKTGINLYELITNIKPTNSVFQLDWTTGNSTYATVNSNGYLTAEAVGETTLMVQDKYSGLSRIITVHSCYPVDDINLSLVSETVLCGQLTNANASVTTRNENYINKLIIFSSSNNTIATIDQQGIIHTLKPGTVTIYATAANDENISASVKLSVIRDFQYILNLPSHLTEIGSEAFADLPAIEAVRIPASVTSIADDAFARSDILILAPEGSYAIQWAQDHGIEWIEE